MQLQHTTELEETETDCPESQGSEVKTYEKIHIYELRMTDPKSTTPETQNDQHFASPWRQMRKWHETYHVLYLKQDISL